MKAFDAVAVVRSVGCPCCGSGRGLACETVLQFPRAVRVPHRERVEEWRAAGAPPRHVVINARGPDALTRARPSFRTLRAR